MVMNKSRLCPLILARDNSTTNYVVRLADLGPDVLKMVIIKIDL